MSAESAQATSRRVRDAIAEILSRDINGDPKPGGRSVVVGLVGKGIQSSRSPIMHRREGERLGLRYVYTLVDFDRLAIPDAALGAVIHTAQQLGFAGLNVTHPFKQSIIAHLSMLSPEAAAIGAVNTVVFGEGGSVGYNTDSWGFAESFREEMTGCSLAHVLQLGAGGAGAAVGQALMELGAETLAIFDIDAERSAQLARALASRFGRAVDVVDDLRAALIGATGIVNTTPVGMAKYPGFPFQPDWLSPRQWVAEIIYFPAETELLRRARLLGCRCLSGAGMAVLQAVRSFELFTGRLPDRKVMKRHFEASDSSAK